MENEEVMAWRWFEKKRIRGWAIIRAYTVFRSLQNHLNGQTFQNDDEIEEFLGNWFANLEPDFFRRGIQKLPDRWREIIANGGEYIID